MKKLKRMAIGFIFYLALCASALNASIVKTTQIEDIISEVTQDSLVLFNIAEVLMDTEISLGTQAWRKFIRTRVDSQTHDELTLFVFQNVPPKAVEQVTPELIQKFQEQGITVFAFTSRGRHEWYATRIPDIDLLTEEMLRCIGIDFSQTELRGGLTDLETRFADYFHGGVIYTTNSLEKGEVLADMLEGTGYLPAKIVFVDDKADSLQSVEAAVKKLGIEFSGYAYSRTAKDHADFDPMVANIQLDWLISNGEVLSDAEAKQIKAERYQGADPDKYFSQLIEKWKSR